MIDEEIPLKVVAVSVASPKPTAVALPFEICMTSVLLLDVYKRQARPFVAVQGAHDMYKIGEYAVYGDVLYRCISDTAYSPEEYAAAWEETAK